MPEVTVPDPMNPAAELRLKRHQQERALLLLGLVLLGAITKPTISACLQGFFLERTAVIKGQEFVVPRWWVSRAAPREIDIWRPCLTIFCKSSKSVVRLQDARINGEMDAWQSAAQETLIEQGYQQPTKSQITSRNGAFTCFESRKINSPASVINLCYNAEIDVGASFTGPNNDLQSLRLVISQTDDHLLAER